MRDYAAPGKNDYLPSGHAEDESWHAQTLWMYLGSNLDAQAGLFSAKTLIILGSLWYPTRGNVPTQNMVWRLLLQYMCPTNTEY